MKTQQIKQLENKSVTKERNSNIELLRILSMFLIVYGHYFVWSVTDMQGTSGGAINNILRTHLTNGLISQSYFVARIGVDIFILITGYFMINSKFNFSRISSVVIPYWTYSWSILILTLFIGPQLINGKSIIKAIFPILFQENWFVSSYLGLILLSPFLIKLWEILTLKGKRAILIILVSFSSVLPMLTLNLDEMTGFRHIGLFITLFYIGGYIQTENSLQSINKKKLLLVFMASFAILSISVITISIVGLKTGISTILNKQMYFTFQDSPLLLLAAIFVFLLFIQLDFGQNIFINKIASTTFGVYLISENPLARHFIWNFMIHGDKTISDSALLFLLYGILSSVLVFAFCSTIESIRLFIMKKNSSNMLKRISSFFSHFFEEIFKV